MRVGRHGVGDRRRRHPEGRGRNAPGETAHRHREAVLHHRHHQQGALSARCGGQHEGLRLPRVPYAGACRGGGARSQPAQAGQVAHVPGESVHRLLQVRAHPRAVGEAGAAAVQGAERPVLVLDGARRVRPVLRGGGDGAQCDPGAVLAEHAAGADGSGDARGECESVC